MTTAIDMLDSARQFLVEISALYTSTVHHDMYMYGGRVTGVLENLNITDTHTITGVIWGPIDSNVLKRINKYKNIQTDD